MRDHQSPLNNRITAISRKGKFGKQRTDQAGGGDLGTISDREVVQDALMVSMAPKRVEIRMGIVRGETLLSGRRRGGSVLRGGEGCAETRPGSRGCMEGPKTVGSHEEEHHARREIQERRVH